MNRERTPAEQTRRAIMRELAPYVGDRTLRDGDELVLFVTVRRPSRRLLAYRIHADGSHDAPLTYACGVNHGVRICRATDEAWPTPLTSERVLRSLPRFKNVREAARFLADFPAIVTGAPALEQVSTHSTGHVRGLGQVVEHETLGYYDRAGNPVSKEASA